MKRTHLESGYLNRNKFLSELPELILEQSAKNNPLGRNIHIGEVVPAIEFLLSPTSDAITGQNIGITGGRDDMMDKISTHLLLRLFKRIKDI